MSRKFSLNKRLCNGEICCQAMTMDSHQCTRKAKIKFDLTKGKKIFGYEVIPKLKCCFFCLQHTVVLTGYTTNEIGWMMATYDLDWDEYLAINPSYLNVKMKEMGYKRK